jgi:hypothetical protein
MPTTSLTADAALGPTSTGSEFLRCSARYQCTSEMTMEPSPTTEATRFTDRERTSPIAKIPATLVAYRESSRASFVPVAMKPSSSKSNDSESQPVLGAAPIITNRLRMGLFSVFPVLLCWLNLDVGRPLGPVREKQNFTTPLKLVLVVHGCRDSLSAGHMQLTTPNLLKRQDALPLPPNYREPDRSRCGQEAFRYRSGCQAVGLLL